MPDSSKIPYLNGFLEVGLYVADLDVAELFYRHLLGCPVFRSDARMRALGIPGGQVLLLFRHGGSVKPSQVRGGFIPSHDARGQQHVCFAIPVAALTQWEARLLDLGIAVESRLEFPNGAVSIYFRDIDGHSIELATPGLWPNY